MVDTIESMTKHSSNTVQNTSNNKLLLFQVGPVKCSLYSNDIQTIIPPPKQEIAGKTGRLPGIFRHSDRIVRVVDVRTKFGLSPSEPSRGRIIIAELPQGSYAFWVDRVLNVIDQEDGRWDILPAALPRDVFTRTFIMDKELILHTECVRLEAMAPSSALIQHIKQLEAEQQPVSSVTQAETKTETPAEKPSNGTQVDDRSPPGISKPESATRPVTQHRPTVAKTDSQATPVPDKPRPQPTRIEPRPAPSTTTTTRAAQTARPIPKVQTPRKVAAKPAPAVPTPRPSTSAVHTASSSTDRFATGSRIGREPSTTAIVPPPSRSTPAPSIRPEIRPEPRPPQTRAATTRDTLDKYEEGGMGWLILTVAILVIGGISATLYFIGAFSDQQPSAPIASYKAPIVEPVTEPVPFVNEPIQVPEAEIETSPIPVVSEAESTPFAQPAETPETADAASAGAAAQNEEFRAEIDRKDRVLTITLNGPENEQVRPLLKADVEETSEKTSNAAVTEADVETTVTDTSPAAEITEAEPEAPKTRLQITHVVVKGDTLWDIAERYVKDPLLYPELARLSGIKNPDRIYPGDIVRIIEK